MPAFASRWVEYGTGLSNTVWFFNCPCSNAGCGCQGKDGYLLLQNSQQSSVYEEGLRAAMGTSFVPLQRWTHLVVTYSAPSGGQSTAKAYKNGLLVSTRSVRELQSIPRPMVYIGRSLNQGDPYVVDATIGAFRVYSSELSASQVRLAYASASTPLAGPAPLIAEYIFSDCPINRTRPPSTARPVGDFHGPDDGSSNGKLHGWRGIATLDAACDAPGAPTGGYAGSASVTDADAAGAAVSVSVELSYGGSYVVSCSVKARGHSGGVSPPSAAVNATVPPGNSIAAQNALLPSGNTGASNAFSRVGNAVDPQESVRIVFAAPLANYLVGQRPASHRLGFITRTTSEFSYCDFDLDSNRCSFVQRLADMLGDAEPTDFAYSSMTPWPAKDCDARFAPANLTAFQSNWPWTSQAYKNASDLVGSTVAAVLRPPSDCAGFGCYSHAAQRWAAYAFGGCAPAPYGPIRSWPAGLCSGARPYDFMSAAAAWTHDFRHFYAAYERTFYEAVSGLASASPTEEYNWAGMLGNMNLFSISPTGSNANITEHRSRHFRLQPELFGFAWATPGAETSSSVAFGSHFFYGATNCLDFYDAEPSGRTFEGNETASDIRRAYPDLTPFDALLLQELRLFQFWQRGVAFFSSFAALRNSGGPSVVPLLKVCSLPLGVALLKFDLAAIAPAGFTTSAESVYKSVPWPEENSAFFADSFPVGASVQAVHADGRIADGGPILYHAIVRIPFFPNASVAGACPVLLVSGICRARAVAHVIAMFTWEVDPSRFVNAPVGVRSFNPSFPAPSTYRTAVFTHTAPRVLRSEQLALADHWIVQNERPLHAGYGHGYLEGRWVDPPNSKYSFWSPATASLAIRIYKTADWRGTRQEWTSVATAVYKDGNLYVVQEVHTQANTRVFTFASDRETRPQYVHSRRMKRATERAPGSRLIRLENVDASGPFSNATVKVNTIVSNFPANVLYATVVDDYSSGRMFENDPSIPFSELPWVVFVVSEPAYVIKLHSRCKPGTRWNWEAALFNRSVAIADLCVDLPAGRYSPREGLLLDEDAELCPSGTFSGAGATECTTCSAGTSSDLGASACYDCPQHTFAMKAGDPCTPCAENLFTPSAKWTFQCVPCFPGTYLQRVPLACVSCPSNKYSMGGALDSCSSCSNGSYPTPDLTNCAPCAPGTHQPAELRPCEACLPGTWAEAEHFGPCNTCPPGQVTTDKQDGCTWCRPGFGAPPNEAVCLSCDEDYASPDGKGCEKCGPGYVSQPDRKACLPCRGGTAEYGRPGECLPCAQNEVAPFEASSNCTACPDGKYASADQRLCFDCPAGTYRHGAMANCEAVSVRAVARIGSSNYTACLPGFVPDGTKATCTPCRGGSYQSGDDCYPCPLNTIAPSAGTVECAPCAAGYVASADAQSCEPCPVGTWRDANMTVCTPVPKRSAAMQGSSAYTVCTSGHVPDGTKATCVPCPAGLFQLEDSCLQCPLNSIVSTIGAAQCTPCAAGNVASSDQQSCEPCPFGTYRAADMSQCTPVPARAAAKQGSAVYEVCGSGKVPSAIRSDCVECRAGSYQLEDQCLPCPPNTITSDPGKDQCETCPEGYDAAADRQSCTPCLAGYYRHAPMVSCQRVPVGSVAPAASRNYTVCARGTVPSDDLATCLSCPRGTYEKEWRCRDCIGNSIAPNLTMTSCIDCEPGTVADATRQQCTACEPGYYQPDRSSGCERCPAALFSERKQFGECEECPAGQIPNEKQDGCMWCRPGYGKPSNASICLVCENDHASPDGTGCKKCEPGFVSPPDRLSCVPCRGGTAESQGAGECIPCGQNEVAAFEGSTNCTACPDGEYASADRRLCFKCPVGSYRHGVMPVCNRAPSRAVALEGSANYTLCNPGFIPDGTKASCIACPAGLRQVGDSCLPCAINHIASAPGSFVCSLCSTGTIASADAQNCEPCPTGTWRNARMTVCSPVPKRAAAMQGSSAYTVCASGHVPDGIKATCVPCPAGQYQLEDSCLQCPLNSIQSCEPCPFGTYRAADMSQCTPVPARAAAMQGSAVYEICGNGQVPSTIRSDCVECRAGSYQLEDQCLPCPPNTITSDPGKDQCETCPEGYEAAADRQSCMPCMVGYYRHAPMVSCQRVPVGSVAPAASSNYTICARGTVPSDDLATCLSCPRGTYEKEWRCRDCIGNMYAPLLGMFSCQECEPGSVADETHQECTPCPSGTARPANSSTCLSCSNGYYSNAPGRAECDLCPPGTQSSDDRVTCVPCPAGYMEANGTRTCRLCEEGTIAEERGLVACTACGPGEISNADRTRCNPCQAGTFKPRNMNICLPCRIGTWAPAGSQACQLCEPGSYASEDSTECIPCTPGTFMPEGTQTCLRCPETFIAPDPGTAFECSPCGAGYTSSANRRVCEPCALGFYRPLDSNSTGCIPCGPGTVSRAPGNGECEQCPSGKVPREDRADCRDCEAGTYPSKGVCVSCPPLTTSRASDATCTRCAAGSISDESRTRCIPCPSSMYLPANSDVCLPCPVNTISQAGSTGCMSCLEGTVSDESQTFCEVCAKGTFRNATLAYCEPCPSGTFAAAAGSTTCTPCSSTQLCPIATSEPIDISDFKKFISQTISEALAAGRETAGAEPAQPGGTQRRGLLGTRRLMAAGDFFRRITSEDSVMSFISENVTYDTNSATILRPEIRTEEVANQRLYLIFAVLVACTGVLLILAGVCLYSYLKIPLAAPSERKLERKERKNRRFEHILKLDRLYTDLIAAKREEVKGGAKSVSAKTEEEEAAEDEEENQKTRYGVVFTMIGIGLAAIAAGYVLLQFSIANFSIIQTLQPGASPSAASIAGPLNVTASFAGFAGPCQIVKRAAESSGNASLSRFDGRAGVDVFVSGIGPVDGSPEPVAETSFIAARRTCLVTWRCKQCRLLAASNVTVDFRLVSRLAFAVAINYAIHVPSNLSIEGVIVPSSQAEFSVFRGTLPVTVPVSLFPLHFEDERDGTPRYDAALRPADNRAAEKGEGSFALCSFTKPLSDPECAGESVAFRVLFNIDNIYVMVYRKVKATVADMLADLSSLTQTAIAVGGQIAVAFLTARYFVKKPRRDADAGEDSVVDGSVASEPLTAHPKVEMQPRSHGDVADRPHPATVHVVSLSSNSGTPTRPAKSARAEARMNRRRSNSFGQIEGLIDIYDDDGTGEASRSKSAQRPSPPASFVLDASGRPSGRPSRPHTLPPFAFPLSAAASTSARPAVGSAGPSSRYAYNLAGAALPIPNLPVRLIDLSGSTSSGAGSSSSSAIAGLGAPQQANAGAGRAPPKGDDGRAAAVAIHL
eukprot:tig00000178_g12823.t1